MVNIKDQMTGITPATSAKCKLSRTALPRAGETLGFSGSTRHSSGPHLHFAVFQTVDGQTRRTFPIWFETKPGKVEFLKEGRDY